jgi:HK97 family phage prohead protease/HK97 family phage major capsid protein
MNKIFNITSSFKYKTESKGVSIVGLASAKGTDRAGDVIPSEAWMKGGLHDFKKNPIILFNHNYDLPIGKAVSIEPGDEGLELEAFISNSAPNGISELIKDGVLGAFSVGFRIKDADYIEETGGLLIKDAELFEVSVVSVPCNQDATFSIAKSFDSDAEYEDFKKTFTNRVDLAGQKLAKEEANASNIASDTPDGANAHMENKMNEEELQAFAKKVAEETAAKMAMKQAEKDAALIVAAQEKAVADEAAAAVKAAEAEAVKSVITTGIESGTEALMADVATQLAAKDANLAEVIAKFATDLEEKNDEITKMRESKRAFGDNGSQAKNLSDFGKEFMNAHMLGVMTDKGFDTKYAREVFEKAGIQWGTGAPDIAQEVSKQIEKEIMLHLKLASSFREITVNGQSTVLPIQPDVNPATWQPLAASAGNLDNPRNNVANTFQPEQVILTAYRLISQTYMDNHIDEEVLVNLMPMLIDSVSRAHARAVDIAILNGNGGSINGLDTFATDSAATLSIGGAAKMTALTLMSARQQMGKYGLDPSELAYVVSQARYYELIADPEFSDLSEVGEMATKLKGTVGAVYGTPVILSDNFIAEAAGENAAYAVNLRNYVIPRLRGVTVEQDYEVGNQRRVIVATQSLGFNELVADDVLNQSCVAVPLVA